MAGADELDKNVGRFWEIGERNAMKKALWWVGGFCAAAAGFLVLGARRVQPVEALTQELEEAWTDSHTVV